jgi:lipopolysaccharide export system permease protein
VFKKLDKLVIKAFIGPFIAVFFITLLVLVMQFFWLYIDEFVGKGLSTGIIFEFIWYKSSALVPLAMPLAVLLSSLMTFGNLGESMELVAIKSSGISLLRFMRPLFIISAIISFGIFLFSNYIIPVAELKSRTLLADIVWAKPAFDIKEGVFYDKIDGFAIKIGKKEADSIIKDVIIYERGANLQDNFIIAKSGVMRTTENKRLLEFNLKDGWRYQERGDRISKNTELIRIGFREYKKQFDLGSLGLRQRTSDTVNKNNQRMQSMSQLRQAIDSIEKEVKKVSEKVNREVFSVFMFSKYFDTGYMKPDISGLPAVKDFDQLIPDSSRRFVNQQAGSLVSSTTLNSEIAATEYNSKQKELRLHKIEWHKKITLSLACMVLFLIGAPLGAIIRKGGLGTPLVFAVIFFIFFYFFSTTGEKYVKENILTSFGGMWMATMVLVPVGVFLTYKALHDSQLFNKEFYFRFWKKLKLVLRRNKA